LHTPFLVEIDLEQDYPLRGTFKDENVMLVLLHSELVQH